MIIHITQRVAIYALATDQNLGRRARGLARTEARHDGHAAPVPDTTQRRLIRPNRIPAVPLVAARRSGLRPALLAGSSPSTVDPSAAEVAHAMDARAYTLGSRNTFDRGRY